MSPMELELRGGDELDVDVLVPGMEGPDYWAAGADPEELAERCRERLNDFMEVMQTSRYWDDCKRNWRYYHGLYGGAGSGRGSTAVESLGRDGQLKQMNLNHFRELIGHVLTLVTQHRPAFETEATKDDHDSLKNAELGDAIVNGYLKEGKLENRLRRAVEHALVLQTGFIFCPWDWNRGEVIAREPGKAPLRDGDFMFCNPTVYDVVWDYNIQEWENVPWVLVRTWENKYDIAARMDDKEKANEIISLESVDPENDDEGVRPGTQEMLFFNWESEYTDVIPVWHFYHKDSDACPGGRTFKFTTNNISLGAVEELPYNELPLFRVVPDEMLMTSLGYSRANDLQAPQEAMNSEMSTILTNHSAAGIQAIWGPTGCELDEHMVGNGVLIVEGGQIPPQGINFAKTPHEFFKFKEALSQAMEMISGVNSVARGQPEPSLRTGEALKVLDSKAIQATSVLLANYYQLIEDVGTFVLKHLPLFMQGQDERVVRMIGENNVAYARTFQKTDLDNLAGVKVQAGNALAKTVSGRLAIADRLMERGFVRTPQEYLTVLNTGQLDPMVRSDQAELDLIKDENNQLSRGMPAYADATDYHVLHIREHKAVINKVEVRMNPNIAQVVYAHLMEHISLLDQPAVARIQMALGYEVPYPPLPPDAAAQAQAQGGGGGEGGAMPAAAAGEQAPGGEPQMQNFEAQQ